MLEVVWSVFLFYLWIQFYYSLYLLIIILNFFVLPERPWFTVSAATTTNFVQTFQTSTSRISAAPAAELSDSLQWPVAVPSGRLFNKQRHYVQLCVWTGEKFLIKPANDY